MTRERTRKGVVYEFAARPRPCAGQALLTQSNSQTRFSREQVSPSLTRAARVD
jgi:hypothetical protein